MKLKPLVAALLLPLSVLAQTAPLLELTDPDGDDVGAGTLVYPREGIVVPGELDLRSLRVFVEGDGLRFEATFQSAIRSPADVKSGVLGTEDLAQFARRGFYAFNLDIYFDTDRSAGSGNTVTLPGRRARIDPAHAWEKAIVLTPRPELMQRQLRDALMDTAGAGQATVDATLDASVFFPTDVRVRGRTVTFMVPARFLPANQLANASIVAFVTPAKLTVEADMHLFAKPVGTAVDRLTLGVAAPEQGRPAAGFGYRGERAPVTTIVDLLMPAAGVQAAQLGSGILAGLNRDNRYGAALQPLPPAPAPAVAASPPAEQGNWFSRALDSIAGIFGGGSAAPAPASAPSPPPANLQSLMQPGVAPAPAAAPAPVQPPVAAPAPAAVARPAAPPAAAVAPAVAPVPVAPSTNRPRDAAFFEEQEIRLRTLRRLRDSGLITEQEFLEKRRQVLEQL